MPGSFLNSHGLRLVSELDKFILSLKTNLMLIVTSDKCVYVKDTIVCR